MTNQGGKLLIFLILTAIAPWLRADDKMILSDSLPDNWVYIPDNVQEIPGGKDDLWWQQFSDPLLDSLISLGIERNYDLRMAMRRMEIARAAMKQAKSGYYPTVTASAGWTADHASGAISRGTPAGVRTESYFNAGLNASWEIDIFGRISAGVKAKKAQYNASRAEYAGAMVSMASQIASTYFTLRSQQRLLQVAEAHAESQMKMVKIAQARYEATLASKLDVAQAWQTYYSTVASIPSLRNSIVSSINALGVLVGEFPPEAAALLAQPGPLPNWKVELPQTLPADLLRRRPDILQAEMEIAQYAAEAGVAKKEFLPTLTIEGAIGTSSRDITNLFGKHSYTWSVSPTLSWTVFDGFSRKYQLQAAREQVENAISNYNLTVMNAVSETNNALNAYGEGLNHIAAVEQLCAQNEEALRLSVERYKNSLSPMTDVVNALLSALSGESELVQAREAALQDLVTIYEALGGGIAKGDPHASGEKVQQFIKKINENYGNAPSTVITGNDDLIFPSGKTIKSKRN